ncbi:MAG TPA: 3-deoxy-8-phosphooctulonate synthase [Planctomycetota bacterium]|nr:3-deoxy-8-phosphooctulonate synthase [Planctomycetota bacterium]
MAADPAPAPAPEAIPPARRTFTIRGQTFGAPGSLFLIAGPDLVEPLDLCLRVGERLRDACARLGVPYIFKGSFDKANRTSASGHRGPGLETGLQHLRAIRERLGVAVLTDVHDPLQASLAAEVADVLQIPAFLCRQTDLVLACARTGKVVNVKKGQFLAPWDMVPVVKKLESGTPGGARETRAILTDRGTSFGYNTLVNDMRGISIMQRTGYPVCFDATHSVQVPGGHGTSSGGQREFVAPLARAAVAAGADAVFCEVHENPAESLVDPDTHLEVGAMIALLEDLVAIQGALKGRRS